MRKTPTWSNSSTTVLLALFLLFQTGIYLESLERRSGQGSQQIPMSLSWGCVCLSLNHSAPPPEELRLQTAHPCRTLCLLPSPQALRYEPQSSKWSAAAAIEVIFSLHLFYFSLYFRTWWGKKGVISWEPNHLMHRLKQTKPCLQHENEISYLPFVFLSSSSLSSSKYVSTHVSGYYYQHPIFFLNGDSELCV